MLQQKGSCDITVGDISVVIPIAIMQELQYYVKHYSTEVSGHGLVEMRKVVLEEATTWEAEKVRTEFVIKEVFLPHEQNNTGGGTIIDSALVHQSIKKLIKEGREKETSLMKLHWHSHCTFGVFHSGTDTDNYDNLQTGDYLISLVLNHAGDILASVHTYKPIRMNIKNVDVRIEFGDTPRELEEKFKKNTDALDRYAAKQEAKRPTTYAGFEPYHYYREENTMITPTADELVVARKLDIPYTTLKKIINCFEVNDHVCKKCSTYKMCHKFHALNKA